MLPRILLSFSLACYAPSVNAQHGEEERTFPVQELRADLAFLKERLERVHPDLYMYIGKDELDQVFDSLSASIAAPLTEYAFFDKVSYLHSRIRDGHTMFLPSERSMDQGEKNAVHLPIRVALVQGRMYVRENYSDDPTIRPGAELTGLNGVAAVDLLEHLRARQIRDGYNESYPDWILDRYFEAYHGFSFGHPRQYRLGLREDGVERLVTVRSLTRDSIKFHRNARRIDEANKVLKEDGISLTYDSAAGLATMVIPDFESTTWRSLGASRKVQDLDGFFLGLRNKAVRHLIIDLRDNQGGDFGPGRRLLTYLIDKPLSFLPGSNEAAMLKPSKYAFEGKIHVLINGGSFSITGIICSYLKENGRADFIGEETAGNRTVICGSPRSFILPVTGIQIGISTRKYRIVPGQNTGHGTLPDHPVRPNLEDILKGRDPAMDLAVGLARQ